MSDLPDKQAEGSGRGGEAAPGTSEAPSPVPARPSVSRRRTRRNPRIWLAVGALALVALAVWLVVSSLGGGSTAPQYTVTAAERGSVAVTVDGSGYIYAADSTGVSPKVAGTVRSLDVEVGDTVQEGDLLFRIFNEDLDAAESRALASYRNSKQAVEQAEIQVMQAEQDLQKIEDQSDPPTRTPSEEDIEIAEEKVDAAEMGLSAARASLSANLEAYEQALSDQDARTVRAPVDGMITALGIARGDQVSGGGSSTGSTSGGSSSSSGNSGTGSSSAPIVITDMRSLFSQVTVNEVDVSSIKRSQKVTTTFDALPNLTITGKVKRISPAGTNTQGVVTFNVDISFDVQDKRLRPGMTSSSSIVTAIARDTVLVPNAAVQTASDGTIYVRVLDNPNGTGTPRDVAVTTGLSNDTMTQVKSGLKAGEYVVTGQRVTASSSSQGGAGGAFRIFGGPGGGEFRRQGSSTSGGSSSNRSSTGGSSSGGSSTGGSSSGGGTGAGGPPPGVD